MAILHQAQLNPSKLELLSAFLPTVSGLDIAEGSELAVLGAYRFDDPAGEVGIEAHLLATGDGRTIHIPVTYRAAPLAGAEEWLVGTLEHSALGTRWVYSACGDPVYGPELMRTILTGGSEVKLEVLTSDGLVERENTVHVLGSGDSDAIVPELTFGGAVRSGADTIITVGTMTVAVHHIVDSSAATSLSCLAGTWPGSAEPIAIASVVAQETVNGS